MGQIDALEQSFSSSGPPEEVSETIRNRLGKLEESLPEIAFTSTNKEEVEDLAKAISVTLSSMQQSANPPPNLPKLKEHLRVLRDQAKQLEIKA